MSNPSERHEVRVRGKGHTIVFTADSANARKGCDGAMKLHQESQHKRSMVKALE